MKHKTLRCTAETAALLLTVAKLAILNAGLHQHDPDRVHTPLNTGWYQLTDGVRREIVLPVTLPAEPGQTLTLYNDTLIARDAGKMLSARGVEYGIEIRAGETLHNRNKNTKPNKQKRRASARLGAEHHRSPYPDLTVFSGHDARHGHPCRAGAADLLLHEQRRHP